MNRRLCAFLLGVREGFRQPYDLASGFTWDDESLNEAFDRGANVGQFLRAPVNHQRNHDVEVQS